MPLVKAAGGGIFRRRLPLMASAARVYAKYNSTNTNSAVEIDIATGAITNKTAAHPYESSHATNTNTLGIWGGGGSYGNEVANTNKIDWATSAWTSGSNIASARNMLAAASTKTIAVFYGGTGNNGGSETETLDRTDRYTYSNNSVASGATVGGNWEANYMATMSYDNSSVSDCLYFIGGRAPDNSFGNGTNRTLRYMSNTWTSFAAVALSRNVAGAMGHGTHLQWAGILFGGSNWVAVVTTTDRWDWVYREWNGQSTALGTARYNAGVGGDTETAYIIGGGTNHSGAYTGAVDKYVHSTAARTASTSVSGAANFSAASSVAGGHN